ncbi:hypothetical protein amb1089 [Paramagnetospirillum magneticum AMB-1]|uniref:Uncharacterized protein n=1 Tax=Paramagnetospirillum magneticum (strain ATCC 700264 / AMB-1) TaxID=342108 RepID=Q2W8D2_PARM1|nr:hypothetical protein amb1089 [Paramagnetospirillum magneticum AMB-1]
MAATEPPDVRAGEDAGRSGAAAWRHRSPAPRAGIGEGALRR